MNTPTTALHGVTRLTHLGVIRIEGEDAVKFIHGQLSHDFALLGQSEARLAALCSPKGRMLASFIGFKRSAVDVVLLCSLDVLPAMVKRLSMFVLRAKARVMDCSGEFALFGLAGTAALESAAPWSARSHRGGTLIDLYPAEGQARQIWVGVADAVAPDGPELSADLWAWGEVRSAVATVTAPVSEAFVPQMLNYESVGGVSFKKGCYPGQEVVARSQFRGILKRRAFVAHLAQPVASGDQVVASADPSQPVGTVVQAAAAPGGGFDAIVSLQLSAVDDTGLHAVDAAGPRLQLLPLPYVLLQDV